jgi:hypothetical protein
LDEINRALDSDYQQKDVYFDFKREVMTNAQDNAQIELTDAQKQQIQINIVLSLSNILPDETIIQIICEILDLNYEEIKDKIPDDEEAGNQYALNLLKDTSDQEGDLIE